MAEGQRFSERKSRLQDFKAGLQGDQGAGTQQTQQTQQQDTSGQQSSGGVFLRQSGLKSLRKADTSTQVQLPGINSVYNNTLPKTGYQGALESGKIKSNIVLPGINDKSTTISHIDPNEAIEGMKRFQDEENDRITSQYLPLVRRGLLQLKGGYQKRANANLSKEGILEKLARIGQVNGASKSAMQEYIDENEKQTLEYNKKVNDAFKQWENKNMDMKLLEKYEGETISGLLSRGDGRGATYKLIKGLSENINMIPEMVVTIVAPEVGLPLMAGDVYIQESQGAFEEMIDNGATYNQAINGATIVGVANASIELLLERFLGGVQRAGATTFRRLFTKNLQKEVVRNITKKGFAEILGRGLLGQIKSSGVEGLEEILQQLISNAFVKTVNSDKDISEGLFNSFDQAFWQSFFFPLGGGSESVITDYSNNKKIEQQADLEALQYVMEGEERKAQRMQQAKQRMKDRFLGKDTTEEFTQEDQEQFEREGVEEQQQSEELRTENNRETTIQNEMEREVLSEGDLNEDLGDPRFQKTEATDTNEINKDLKDIKDSLEKMDDNTFFNRIMASINKGGKRNFVVFNKNGQKSVLRVMETKSKGKGTGKTVTVQVMQPSKKSGNVIMSQFTYNPGNLSIEQKQGIITGFENWGKTGKFTDNTSNNEKYQLKYEEKDYNPGVANKNEKNISGTEGVKQRNKINDETIEQLAKKYGVKVEVIKGLVKVLKNGKWTGGYAYGKYLDQVLTLSEQIKESTAPHELLHAIFDMIDPETKAYLISQVMKSEGWSAKKAEEWLADSFSNFFRTGKIEGAPKSTWGKIKIFFKRVRSFINGMERWRSELEEIFSDIITSEGIEELQGRIDQNQRLQEAKARMKKRFMEYAKNAEKMQKKAENTNKSKAKYQEIEQDGIKALQKIANGAEYVRDAMNREDLKQYGGETGISFYWGEPGDKSKKYKGGYGISHIAEKHGADTLLKMIEVLARGKITRYAKSIDRVSIGYDGYTAILSLSKDNGKETRLVTGRKDNEKKTDGSSEVSTQSTPTQTSPTFSRTDLGAVLSKDIIYKNDKNANKNEEKYQTVYHGSPAEFEKFDSSHMGEGEGDQVHGRGHYVAVDQKTAKRYAELGAVLYKGKQIGGYDNLLSEIGDLPTDKQNFLKDIAYDMAKLGKTAQESKNDLINKYEGFIEYLEESIKDNEKSLEKLEKSGKTSRIDYNQLIKNGKDYIKRDQQLLKVIKSIDVNDFSKRHLYEVEIPDSVKADTPTGSNYFEEKEILSREEIDNIMNALLKKKTKGADRVKKAIDYDLKEGDEISGRSMVFNLRAGLGDKQASKFLESLGYDGIHYYGLRDGEAYVIFNDDALEITNHEKYQTADDIDPNVQSPNALTRNYGGLLVMDRFISKKQKKKALDVDKSLLVSEGRYEGLPYMWTHTNKYSGKIIPNFENVKDSRYKEFTEQGKEIARFTNNEDMSKSYADQKSILANTRKFNSIKEFNDRFNNISQDGTEIDSEWKENGIDKWVRHEYYKKIEKDGDEYVLRERDVEGHKYKDLEKMSSEWSVEGEEKLRGEKAIIKDIKKKIHEEFIDNPDFKLYDDVKIGKKNGEYIITLTTNKELGRYSSKEEALAKGWADAYMKGTYHYKGIIQNMHNPLIVDMKNRIANWNDLGNAYDFLENEDKEQLNKLIDYIDYVQDLEKKRVKDRSKVNDEIEKHKKAVDKEVSDARMDLFEAKKEGNQEKIKEADQKELATWNKRTAFWDFVNMSEDMLYRDPTAEEKTKLDNILKKYPDFKTLENAFNKYGKKYYKLLHNELTRWDGFVKVATEQYGISEATLSLLHGIGLYDLTGREVLKNKTLETNDYVFYALRKGGYDGVLFKKISDYGGKYIDAKRGGDVVAVFNSSQFKSWDNADPTDSKFISYQETEDNDGRALTVGQAEHFKESRARVDENLDKPLMRVYHTTTDNIVPFSKFNPVGTPYYRFGENIVNYYTDDQEMSGSYSHGAYVEYDSKGEIKSMKDAEKYLDKLREEKAHEFRTGVEMNYSIVKDGNGYYIKNEWNQDTIDEINGIMKEVNLTKEELDILKGVYDNRGIWDYGRKILGDRYYDGQEGEFHDLKQKWIGAENKINAVLEKRGTPMGTKYGWSNFYRILYESKKNPDGYDTGMHFESKEDLIERLENEIIARRRAVNRWQYVGYLNITNPYIIDAEGRNWDTVRIGRWLASDILDRWNNKTEDERNKTLKVFEDAKAEYEEGVEVEGWDWYGYAMRNNDLKDAIHDVMGNTVMMELDASNEMYGSQIVEEAVDVVLGGMKEDDILDFLKHNVGNSNAESTNDVVKSILESNRKGETNYDGVIIKNVIDYGGDVDKRTPHNVYVTFASNQFKSIYNENPTDDADIRYQEMDSDQKDSDGESLSIGQAEFFADSKARDSKGNLLVLYHGTQAGDFTVYMKGKNGISNSLAKVGYRFTPSKQGALNFAKESWRGDAKPRADKVYLNITNPKIYEPSKINLMSEEEKNAVLDKQWDIYKKKKEKADALSYTKAYGFFHDEYDHSFDERHVFGWLTSSYERAKQYKGKLGEYDPESMRWYADKNGLDYDKIVKDVEEYEKLKEEADKEYNKYLEMKINDPYEDFMYDIYKLDSTMDVQWTRKDLQMALNSYETPNKYVEQLKAQGYDGIIIKGTEYDGSVIGGGARNDQYVAFDSNQIKRTTNLTPTDNEDIRYQKAEYEYDENGNITNLKFGDNSEFDPSIFGEVSRKDQIEEDKENEKSNPFYNAWVRYNNQNYEDDQLTFDEFIQGISERADNAQKEYDQKMRDLFEAQNDPKLLDLQLRAVKLMEEEGKVGKKFGKNVSKEVRDRQQAEVEKKREQLIQDIVDYMYPGLKTEEITYEMQQEADQKEAEWEMLGREGLEEKLKYFKKDKNGNWEAKTIKIENPQEKLDKLLSAGKFDEIFTPLDRVLEWKTPQGQKGYLDNQKDPKKYKSVLEKINKGTTKTKVTLKDVTRDYRALEKYRAEQEAEKERRKKERQEEFAKKKQEEYKKLVRMSAFQRLIDMQRLEKYPFLSENEIKERYGFTDEEWKKITEQEEIKLPKKWGDKARSDFNKAVDSYVRDLIKGLDWQNKMKQREAEKNLGEIGEIDVDVLLGRDEEKGQKEVEEFEKLAKEKREEKKLKIEDVKIDEEREQNKEEKAKVDKLIKSTKSDKTVRGSIKEFTSNILTPVSTKIREISPKIYREVMRYFQNKDIITNERLKEAELFLQAMRKIRKDNPVRFMDIWVNLANRNIGYANGLLKEYGVTVPTELLDKIYLEAQDVGLNINYLGSYYPLSVKAPRSFLEELMKVNKKDIASEIEKRIIAESQKKGGPLEEVEITAIINEVIAGEENKPDVNLGNAHLKKRNTEIKRTAKMLEYCDDPISTLIGYIEGMTQSIERAKFLGKSRSGNVHTLADYVYNAKNGLTPDQQDDLMDLLKAVFNDANPSKAIQTWRDIATLTTLGSPSSTLTQLGDLSFSVYENGWRETLKAVWDVWMGRKAFDLIDMGVLNRGEEYANINSRRNLLQKAIHNVFKLTFFSKFDTFGKSAFIQSTWNKWTRMARKGDKQLRKDIMKWTDDKYMTDKIIKDLSENNFSQEVALIMYMKLSNIQPLTRAQMPKAYLNNPNGRLFYQFKTFGIKQLDYVLQETREQTKNFKNLSTGEKLLRIVQIANMVFVMTLLGVGADELKDITMRRRNNSLILRWLFGDEVGTEQIWEKMEDNVLKLFGLSRYTVMQMKSDPVDALTSLFTTLPATNIINYPFKDIYKAFKKDGSINWRNPASYQLIPVIGKYRYWIYGGGQDKQQESLGKKKKKSGGGSGPRSRA